MAEIFKPDQYIKEAINIPIKSLQKSLKEWGFSLWHNKEIREYL